MPGPSIVTVGTINFKPTLRQHGLEVLACMECGAVVVDWPEYLELHGEWHNRLENRLEHLETDAFGL